MISQSQLKPKWRRTKVVFREALSLVFILVLGHLRACDGRDGVNPRFAIRCHEPCLAVFGIPSSTEKTTTSSSSGVIAQGLDQDRHQESTRKDIHSSFQNDLIRAKRLAEEDQILASARQLRHTLAQATSTNQNLTLAPNHRRILDVARRVEQAVQELSSFPDPNVWTKQGEVHDGQHDIIVHYKLDKDRRLISRIEFLVDKSMLVPILATLVETELYHEWVPRWRFPPVGIHGVRKLTQTGRTNQVLHVDLEIPWKRDVIVASTGVDDVDGEGLLGIHLGPLPMGSEIGDTGVIVPSPKHGVERVDFEGCFVFQKCPDNHPVLKHSKSKKQNDLHKNVDSEDLILVGFSMVADAKISHLFPQWIVNFIVRVAIVRLFRIFHNVAEDVHSGKRPDHAAAIARKRADIYDWIDERVGTLLLRDDL